MGEEFLIPNSFFLKNLLASHLHEGHQAMGALLFLIGMDGTISKRA
jgi:hypothetical protein